MGLSSDLISQFVKITNDTNKSKKETTAYGTVVDYNGGTYVRLDGSDLLTPMTKTVGVKDGDRVTISIKDHTATVTGNISSPSASSSELKAVDDKVGNFTTVITKELIAQSAKIEDLTADNVTIKDKLTANEGYISDLQADNLTINKKLTANEAEVKKLTADYAEINSLVAKKASVDDLEAINASVHNLASDYGNFKELTTDKFIANEASIKKLDTDKANITDLNAATAEIDKLLAKKASIDDLDATNARIDTLTASQITTDYLKANYANIDLANVNNTWIQNGIIKNGAIGEAAIHEGAITNAKIADATIEAAKIKSINADTITAGTLKTNRLIITGEDGTDSIVKAINTANGVAEANSMKIQAASIDVVDLSAFNAKIAQFILKDNAIYSGKTSITDPTSGIYISTTGIGVGDGSLNNLNETPVQIYANGFTRIKGKNGYLILNTATGDLDINATTLKIGSKTVASNEDVTDAINNIEIGGRNYMLDSAFSKYTPDGSNITKDGEIVTFNGGDPKNYLSRTFSSSFKSSARGKKLALSMDIKVNEEIAFGTTNPWIGFEVLITYTDGTQSWLDLLGGKRMPTEVADWKRYTSIVAVKDTEIKSIFVSIICRDFTGSISVRHPKVEISTEPTDWTPAPEDINSDLDAIKTRVTSAETNIEQNSTDIALRATKTELTNAIDGVNTTIGQLETSIQENANAITLRATKTEVTTAKSEAISAAATDASTKADAALADAKTYTDAQIKISADSITSTVSKTYQTKSGMSNYLTTASAANTYSKKQLPDTRNDNQPPSWYMTNYPRQVVTEFKYSNIIGLPKNETYCTLETTVPWNDKSGGYPKQRAQMAGKVYYRIGISESEWGIWKDTLDTATADSTYATSKSLEAVSGNLNAYVESSTNMIQDINGWQFNWNKILRADEANVEEHQDYITFQNGDIILGESGSELKVKIGNDAIQFKGENGSETAVTPDSDATAWITGQLFNINAGEIHTSLKVGNLQFTPRPNGNFSITIT